MPLTSLLAFILKARLVERQFATASVILEIILSKALVMLHVHSGDLLKSCIR